MFIVYSTLTYHNLMESRVLFSVSLSLSLSLSLSQTNFFSELDHERICQAGGTPREAGSGSTWRRVELYPEKHGQS